MEAMVGANIATMTIYDMCKSLDKNMVIGQNKVLLKSGGKSGYYENEDYRLFSENELK